jgi:hypothetical protein
MMEKYILQGREPVVEPDVIVWGTWYATANRHVGKTWVGGPDCLFVSTVFLGIDNNWGEGPPLLFETMVFDHRSDEPGLDLYMDRYSTWDEAAAGHICMCERARLHLVEEYLTETF